MLRSSVFLCYYQPVYQRRRITAYNMAGATALAQLRRLTEGDAKYLGRFFESGNRGVGKLGRSKVGLGKLGLRKFGFGKVGRRGSRHKQKRVS